jgi:signal transduction histidine kinase
MIPVSLGRMRIPRLPSRAQLPLLRAGWQRSAALIRAHPLLVEGPLAALLVGPSPQDAGGTHHAGPAGLALIAVIVLPLLWRRRAPFLVFWVVFGTALVQAFISHGISDVTDELAILVAFYTVAAAEPHRRVLAAATMLECAAPLLVFIPKAHPDSPPPVVQWASASVLVAATGLLGYYMRTRRAYLAALVDRAARLEREGQREAELAAAAERAKIAREVHDIVAHNIAVMIALSDGAAYTIAADPDQALALVTHASRTGRSSLTEMHRLLDILRQPGGSMSGNAPQPALADLDTMISTVREAGLPVRLTVSGQSFPLPPSAQLALYRIIQEALTNTLKHANATSAHVHLDCQDGEVSLEVTDNGRPGGIAAPAVPGTGSAAAGHGLAGMRERAAVFGGNVSAGPRPEGGWRVHARLRADPVQASIGQATGTEGT